MEISTARRHSMQALAYIQKITEHINNGFMLCNLGENYPTYANKLALDFYADENGLINLQELFINHHKNTGFVETKKKELDLRGFVNTSNVVTIANNGESKVSEVQIGFSNDEKTEIYILMTHHEDRRMAAAKHQIDTSYRADAILEYDDNLTIFYCNYKFYQTLEAQEDHYLDYIERQLSNTFRKDKKAELLKEISRGLKRNKIYNTEVEIINLEGEKHWYSLDLQRTSFDNSGEKLMCSLVNIEERKKATIQLNSFSQYFEAMQSLSGESLFQIDVTNRVLHMKGDLAEEFGLPKSVEDYPISVYPAVHPDDLDDYKEFATRSLAGENQFLKVRLKIATGEFRWYEINSMIIYDELGKAVEILGKVKNVHEEQEIKADFKELNQYFEAMQNITDESIYVIDLETRTLVQKGKVAEELGITSEVTNYPESVYGLMHPEDLGGFKEFADKALHGVGSQVSVRVLVGDNQYCWYELISKVLKDELGQPSKIFGKMNNIQVEQTLKKEFTSVNQYYNAMQSLSRESLYTVDIKSKVLYCQGVALEELGLTPMLEGYPESLIHLVLPENLENYKEFAYLSLSGVESRMELQIRNKNGSYQWYELHNMIIRDEQDVAVEILGRIRNINKEHTIEEEYSSLNQYFNAMQQLTEDILWRIDIKTNTLHHFVNSELEIKKWKSVPDYVSTMISSKMIHPDDAENYLFYRERWYAGNMKNFNLRVALIPEKYVLYRVHCEKIFNKQGVLTEILGRLENIQEEQALKEDNFILNQYLTAMQEDSAEILYRVDVKTMTLYRILKTDGDKLVVEEMPDYVNTVIAKKMIHPEDAEEYRSFVSNWYAGGIGNYSARFRLDGEEYQWYSITGKKIFDDEGKLKEVFGKMVNIQSVYKLKTDYSLMNQYYQAIQELSDDILYRIDVKTMTLYHNIKSPQADKLGQEIPDYINTFIQEKIVHPDDADLYLNFVNIWFEEESSTVTLRFALMSEEYEWYEMSAQKIYDEDGNIIEALGKMVKVQKNEK